MPEFEVPELNAEFVFRRRPVAIPGDLRPGWRIGLVTLLLKKCCRSNRSSLSRLHVLSWGIRTRESRVALQSAVRGDLTPDALVVRVEPFLNRAVDFALGENLVRRVNGGKVELTPDGLSLANELEQSDSAFVLEKQFMGAIGQKVTETLVNRMFGWKA